MSVLVSIPVLWHHGELCQSIRVLQWKKKIVWVVFFTVNESFNNPSQTLHIERAQWRV